MSKSIIEIAQDLISIESTADKQENLHKIITYVEDFFSDSPHLHIKKYESNNKPSIVVSTHDTLNPDIILSGHLDVVHAPQEMFQPVIEHNILKGRGAADMKSECAMMMKVLKELSPEIKTSVSLMLTTDEEIGGAHGTRYLVDEVGYTAKIVLIPDSGEHLNELLVTNKGILLIKLTAQGKPSHGSRPWEGVNAISLLFEDVHLLQKNKIFSISDSTDHWYNTCSMNTISGGSSPNKTADYAECTLDIRHTEKVSREQLIALLNTELKNCSYEIIAEGAMRHTPLENPLVQKYIEILKNISQQDIKMSKSHGAIDGRFFSGKGIATIVSRPESGGQHTNEEWMNIESLNSLYNVYKEYIQSLV